MSFIDMAHSHVQRMLREGMELDTVVQDNDGDYPFRAGTAMYYVSVGNHGHMVKVWSHAVYGLKRSKAVLREVNSTNERLTHGRAYLQAGHLVVEALVPVQFLTPAYLAAVCEEVGRTADRVGQLLATVHNGTLCFADAIEAAG